MQQLCQTFAVKRSLSFCLGKLFLGKGLRELCLAAIYLSPQHFESFVHLDWRFFNQNRRICLISRRGLLEMLVVRVSES